MFWYAITIISMYLFIGYLRNRKYKLPPGPPSLPFVGSLPFLPSGTAHSDKLFNNRALRIYSKYFTTVHMGNCAIIIIQDFELARDLLSRPEFSGRATMHKMMDKVRGYNGKMVGVAGTQGHVWTEQRRFILKHLRDFGFGKQKMDAVIQDEANDAIRKLIDESRNGERKQNVLVENLFQYPVLNLSLIHI